MANGFQNKLCARRRIEMKKFLVAMYSVLLLLFCRALSQAQQSLAN